MPISASAPIQQVTAVIGMYLREAAHLAHVLLVVHGDDHRAGREEQQRLEEGVGHEMEDRRAVGRDAERHRHVAELRERRVGDDPLDVVVHHARATP